VLKETQVHRVLLVHKELRVIQVHREPQVLKVIWDHKGHRDFKVFKEK
jgi:hypothetical protein